MKLMKHIRFLAKLFLFIGISTVFYACTVSAKTRTGKIKIEMGGKGVCKKCGKHDCKHFEKGDDDHHQKGKKHDDDDDHHKHKEKHDEKKHEKKKDSGHHNKKDDD